MESFLKVLGASVFLITIVALPIILATLFFLFLLQERPAETKPENFITVTSYVKEGPRTSPAQETLISCQDTPNLCKEIVRASRDAKNCQESNESVVFEGYFQSYVRGEVYDSCPEYNALLEVMEKAQRQSLI